MLSLPVYIGVSFSITTLICIFFFFRACNFNRKAMVVILAWTLLQGIIGISGFYSDTSVLPPRFLLAVLPALIGIVLMFITANGRVFLETLDQKWLTILHVVRVPVEIVLYWLFLNHTLPKIMTFEGWNLDIISGISALLVFYFGYIAKKLGPWILLIWNFIGLGLLLNIVIIAILSAPFPFQKFGFEQPNIAVLYFPFNWLPAVVVPLVLFSHLVCIKQIMASIKKV
jgi:hypothetical protein